MKHFILLIVLFFLHHHLCEEEYIEKKYARAVVESCPGCSLNRLHDVKKFVYDDLPKYDSVEFKKINGAPPELIFYNEEDVEMERISLREKSREECNLLLLERGFLLKLAAQSANCIDL